MPSSNPPVKGAAYTTYVSLTSQADANLFQTSVTLATGDVTVSKDGGAFANIGTLPVEIGTTGVLALALTATEMDADTDVVRFRDAAGAEWADLLVTIHTVANNFDGLVADTEDIQARIPAALVSGRIDASVGAVAAGAIDAAAIAADAITDAKVAGDVTIASVTGAVGSVTGNVGGNVVGSVASVTAGVTVTTNNDKTGYALSAAAIQAIWDALTSALTTVGSIGKLLVDNINATISSRLASASYTAPPTAAANADAVWDEARSGHVSVGSFGEGAASVQGNVTGSVGSVSGAVGSVAGNVDGSVASVTGAVGSVTGNVTGSVGSLATQAKADVNAEVVDVLTVDTFAEPSAVPAATSTLKDKINWLFALARNKLTQTATTQTLYADDGSTDVGTATVSDDSTTATRGEWI